MRLFELNRHKDITGISGEGLVAYAVEFTRSKRCAVSWQSNTPSVAIHSSLRTATAVHGHNGASTFKQIDLLTGDGYKVPQPVWLLHKKSTLYAAAEVALMPNGQVVMEWLLNPIGIEVFQTWADFQAVHNSLQYTQLVTLRQLVSMCGKRDSLFDVLSFSAAYRRVRNDRVWYRVKDLLELGSSFSGQYWTTLVLPGTEIIDVEVRGKNLPNQLWVS